MTEKGMLSDTETDTLVDILANQADNAPAALGPQGYMDDLIRKTGWPDPWKETRRADLTGIPNLDARRLVEWAAGQGTNPDDPRFTVLGGLTRILYEDVALEDRQWLVALTCAHGLYKDEALNSSLMMRYQVPCADNWPDQAPEQIGPEFEWEGPDEPEVLQAAAARSDFLDVGFLKRAIARAASVCRVEIPEGEALGTGFLVSPTLLLTNYHVLCKVPCDDKDQRARDMVLRFGNITAADGQEAEGQTFKLDSGQPVVSISPPDELDYALLRVEDSVQAASGIKPAPFTLEIPVEDMALHILQHPLGETLKLATSLDAVDKVFAEEGLVQYLTRARGGSSGAPCFSNGWEVIALHHSERAKLFGSVREGIIFQSIHEEIKDHL